MAMITIAPQSGRPAVEPFLERLAAEHLHRHLAATLKLPLLSRVYFGIQVLLIHCMSQAQWMDSKSSDGSDANALAPVLGDGEVD